VLGVLHHIIAKEVGHGEVFNDGNSRHGYMVSGVSEAAGLKSGSLIIKKLCHFGGVSYKGLTKK
jgi:hypothetical protein